MKQELEEKKQELVTKHSVHQLEQDCYPFNVVEVENEEQHIFIPIIGNSIATNQNFATKEESVEYIKSKPYDLILAMICETLKLHESYETEQKELKKISKKSSKKS